MQTRALAELRQWVPLAQVKRLIDLIVESVGSTLREFGVDERKVRVRLAERFGVLAQQEGVPLSAPSARSHGEGNGKDITLVAQEVSHVAGN